MLVIQLGFGDTDTRYVQNRLSIYVNPFAPRRAVQVQAEVRVDKPPVVEVEKAGQAVARVGHRDQPLHRRRLLPSDEGQAQPGPHPGRARILEMPAEETELDRTEVRLHP